jgi:hypothetical protein
MNRFLTFADYQSQIQLEDLQQIVLTPGITQPGDAFTLEAQQVLFNMEMVAQEEISSYIRNRYIVDQIFSATQHFNINTTYYGKNLIQYSETEYDPAIAYAVNDRFSYKDFIYKVLVPGPYLSPLISDPSVSTDFTLICQNNQYYYANLPIAEYNKTVNYKQGDLVWFLNNIYVALQNVTGITPGDTQNLEARYGIPSVYSNFIGNTTMVNPAGDPSPTLQKTIWQLYPLPLPGIPVYNNTFSYNIGDRFQYSNNTYQTLIPGTNIGIADPSTSPLNFRNVTGSTYSFSGIMPENTTYWTLGDNRNPLIKMYLIDILLYHVHSRINPRNIPELRAIRYDGNNSFQSGGAIGWLKKIEKGLVSLDAPEIVLTQGGDIRFGSSPKKNNYF